MNEKKNLRRVSMVVTTQTLYHLHHYAAMAGYSEKDIGRVVDKIVREICAAQKIATERDDKRRSRS